MSLQYFRGNVEYAGARVVMRPVRRPREALRSDASCTAPNRVSPGDWVLCMRCRAMEIFSKAGYQK